MKGMPIIVAVIALLVAGCAGGTRRSSYTDVPDSSASVPNDAVEPEPNSSLSDAFADALTSRLAPAMQLAIASHGYRITNGRWPGNLDAVKTVTDVMSLNLTDVREADFTSDEDGGLTITGVIRIADHPVQTQDFNLYLTTEPSLQIKAELEDRLPQPIEN